jgi:3-hydroxyacyl-CoA dehydrogenase / enoyl-CoA hydratase / 3-hydroxybutyryl-CoA epimerase
MNTALTHFRIESKENDRLVVWLDVAGRSVNVLWEPVFDDLEKVLDRIESSIADTRAVILRSGKANGFAVGADLKRISAVQSDEEIQAFLQRGQQLYGRWSRLAVPTIAVLESTCLGGGLEFAMACRYRLIVDAPRLQVGMPETKLGLIPGWGGTQRFVRLIGLESGLAMLIGGDSVDSQTATQLGLADRIVSADGLEGELDSFVSRVINQPIPDFEHHSLKLGSLEANRQSVELARSKFNPLTPSQAAVVRAVEIGLTDSFQAGLDAERHQFYALLISPEVRQALDRFTNRNTKA